MYPAQLNPYYTQPFTIANQQIEIPKCVTLFQPWKGTPFIDTLGSKPLVSIAAQPMFAEMAVHNLFETNGWQARWLQLYGRQHRPPLYLAQWQNVAYANQTHQPISEAWVNQTIASIAVKNQKAYTGCWDIIAWKDNTLLFIETRRNNKVSVAQSQPRWLAAGLAAGLSPEHFLVVQWDFNPRCM